MAEEDLPVVDAGQITEDQMLSRISALSRLIPAAS